MKYLPLVAVLLEFPGYDPIFAPGQTALRPPGVVEIDQDDRVPVAVRCENARRTPARAAFPTFERRQFEDDVAPEQRWARRGRLDPFDGSGRQVVKHVDDTCEVEPA